MTSFIRTPDINFAMHATYAAPFLGIQGEIFTEQWGRTWAGRLRNSTFDPIAGAGQFLQNSHGAEVAGAIISRCCR